MDERGALAGAAVFGRSLEGAQALLNIGSVDLGKVEVGKVGNELGDAAAGSVHFHRHADGVAVVFYAEDDRQLVVGRGVERFPKLAL